jgi:hypothetical protein
MLRPIASNELAWLVRLLVAFCRAFNDTLGLTPVPPPTPTDPPATILEVGGADELHGCMHAQRVACPGSAVDSCRCAFL